MDRTLRDHISFLEQRLQELSGRLMENARTLDERNRLEIEIRAAELALSYYRKALDLEKQVRNHAG